MAEEKNNQNQKEEECPLCKVSEDTLEILKGRKDKKVEESSLENNEKSRKEKE